MDKKSIIKKSIKTVAIGSAFLLVLFLISIPKKSKLFGSSEVSTEMVRTGDCYTAPILAADEKGEFQIVQFKIDPRVVDSLGFTGEEVKASCSAGEERAREYVSTFTHKEAPELKLVEGKPTVVMSVVIDQRIGNDMFISGEVTKGGKALPMRATIEDPSK